MDGWMDLKSILRIAYSIQKVASMFQATDEIREAFDITSLKEDGVYPEVDKFKESMTSLASATKQLAIRVLRALALALGQDQVSFIIDH